MDRPASLYSAPTDLCADAIAAHPAEAGLFAMGTYHVTQAAGKEGEEADASPAYSRRGRVTLHQLDGADEALKCETLDRHDCAAVLDLSWLHSSSSSSTLIAALADGRLACHSLCRSSSSCSSRLAGAPRHLRINAREALCLSLDVTPDARGLVSQSDGTLAYVPDLLDAGSSSTPAPTSAHDDDDDASADEDALGAHRLLNAPSSDPRTPRGLETWLAHGYEAWCVSFSSTSPSVAWSGGDDVHLKGWDLRQRNTSAGRTATFAHTRSFSGGVTALQPAPLREHAWAVGSYDATLRIFDARNTRRPVHGVDVGGGVWRVKWHPSLATKLLLGTMHDGFKVLDVQDEAVHVVKRFEGHESLAYGCDWDRGDSDESGVTRVVSCSFYDELLHVWRG